MADTSKRKHYQLSVMRETAAEMARLRHPGTILESFLLSSMGGTGALGGFAALADKNAKITQPVVRGMVNQDLGAVLVEWKGPLPNSRERSPYFRDLGRPFQATDPFALVLACPLADDRLAVAGLSPAMHGREYDSQDREFLMGIAYLLQVSLNTTLFSTRIEIVNAELEKRNAELDRQVFHLDGLRELSREAGAAVDIGDFLDTFLPTLLGRFSRHQGLVVIQNRAAGSVWMKSMGIEPEPVPAKVAGPDTQSQTLDVDRLLFLCLSGVRNKRYLPLHTESVLEIDALSGLVKGFEPETAFLFMVKDQMFGAVLLGTPLEDRHLSDPEKELLYAFVSQSVLHLKNADSFQTIVALNRDLERQNAELRKTIHELVQARDRISVLETAARRVLQVVTQKAERILQVKILDFLLLIGISLALATLFNTLNPKGIHFFTQPRPADAVSIDEEKARSLLSAENALLIDARPREFYELSHAGGAINIPPNLFDPVYKSRFQDEDPDRPLIIYGKSISRLWDESLARKFLGRDHGRVYLFQKGITNPLGSEGVN